MSDRGTGDHADVSMLHGMPQVKVNKKVMMIRGRGGRERERVHRQSMKGIIYSTILSLSPFALFHTHSLSLSLSLSLPLSVIVPPTLFSFRKLRD